MPRQSDLAYRWKNRTPHVVPASVAGEELERLRVKYGKRFTPRVIAEENADPSKPLYPEFTWDGDLAIRRLQQIEARDLMRDIVVIHVTSEGDQEPTRVYVSVLNHQNEADEPRQYYQRLDIAMSDPVMRADVLEDAWRDIQAFQQKYDRYLDLSRVMLAFEDARAQAKRVADPI